jgi:hypothetical protein
MSGTTVVNNREMFDGRCYDPAVKQDLEWGLFKAIAAAVDELRDEARRVTMCQGVLGDTIPCGELQKILNNAQHSTRLLRKIRFK